MTTQHALSYKTSPYFTDIKTLKKEIHTCVGINDRQYFE